MASERNITLTAEFTGEDLFVEGDETKISIALNNLVKNAITFTDDGGHVLVKGEALPGYVKVSVIDDGIGIPMKDLPHIFERFFQVESHLTRRHNGMGLGLSVAKVMIEMHGGRIWAESLEGRGSNFTFLLPLKAVEAEATLTSFTTLITSADHDIPKQAIPWNPHSLLPGASHANIFCLPWAAVAGCSWRQCALCGGRVYRLGKGYWFAGNRR